ncbi:MAG: LysR substrate-binding domain-containing protein [Rhizobiaceae bacterium]
MRLFEAAGRYASFKLAAAELEVTPSAVSHGVQTLEDWLGSPLFVRSARGLVLSATGAEYLQPVREALALLAAGSEQIPGRRVRDALVVSVPPTLGARFLLPRLERFRTNVPGIPLAVDTSPTHVQFPRDAVDLAIRMGRGDWPSLHAVHLMDEFLIPVSAPALKESWRDVTDLSELPLIHVTSTSQDWLAWAEAAGAGPVDCDHGLKVDTIQMAFDAAASGLGIAIGRRPLVDTELQSGILVPFFPTTIKSQVGYWLVGPQETMDRPEIRSFRNWLLGEVARTARSNSLKQPRPSTAAIPTIIDMPDGDSRDGV